MFEFEFSQQNFVDEGRIWTKPTNVVVAFASNTETPAERVCGGKGKGKGNVVVWKFPLGKNYKKSGGLSSKD